MKNRNIQYPMSNIQCPNEPPRNRVQGLGFRKRGQSYDLMFCLWLALWTAGASAEPTARDSFDAGRRALAASNYPAARDSFLEAAAAAPAEKLDPSAAFYNAGLSAYAAGDMESAADAFARATSGADLGLQSQAYYNRGNALFHQVGVPSGAMAAMPLPAMSTQALDTAAASIGEAVQMYENAIALDPADEDAKANYELAILKQQQIQQQQQQQQEQQQQEQQKQDQEESQAQQDQPQQEEQKEEQPQPQPQQAEQTQEQEQQQAQPEESSEEMTPEEAAMMLDAMKAQEQSQRDRLHPFFGRPVPVDKDW